MRALIILTLIVTLNALDKPIIGLLSQESYLVQDAYPDAHSFIVASYVKFLESSGARVVPIWIGQDDDYYLRVINYTNGVLFPGGGTYFNESKGYGEAAKSIYKLAKQRYDNNDYFPIMGICLGLQVLAFADTDGTDVRQDCSAKGISLPLEFRPEYKTSRLLSAASDDLIQKLETQNLTYNYHRYCLLEEAMKEHGILENWKILSTNKDENDLEFISTMEHVKYPFYGVQYHPEKNNFEFKSTKVSHSIEAISFSQYLANFFVQETKKNSNKFPSTELEQKSLIYNYDPVYSIVNTSYEQLYLFKTEDYTNNLI